MGYFSLRQCTKNTPNDFKLSHQATGGKGSGTNLVIHTHAWGVGQADKYIHSLIARFSWLAENQRLSKRRGDIKPGYYCFPEGRHLIFYTISQGGIDIIGMPHQSMDIIGHFEEIM